EPPGAFALSLHDALPICFRVARLSRNWPRYCLFTALVRPRLWPRLMARARFSSMDRFSQVPARGSWNTRATRAARLWVGRRVTRSEEHTSELQSRENLVC